MNFDSNYLYVIHEPCYGTLSNFDVQSSPKIPRIHHPQIETSNSSLNEQLPSLSLLWEQIFAVKSTRVEALCILSFQMILSVYSLHQLGFCHRNINPNAFILHPPQSHSTFPLSSLVVSLSDFSFVEHIRNPVQLNSSSLLASEAPVTNSPNTPPEYFGVPGSPLHVDGTTADVFSLGVTLFQLAFGMNPWTLANCSDAKFNLFRSEGVQCLLPANQLASDFEDIPESFFDLLDKMLFCEPALRLSPLQVLRHKFFACTTTSSVHKSCISQPYFTNSPVRSATDPLCRYGGSPGFLHESDPLKRNTSTCTPPPLLSHQVSNLSICSWILMTSLGGPTGNLLAISSTNSFNRLPLARAPSPSLHNFISWKVTIPFNPSHATRISRLMIPIHVSSDLLKAYHKAQESSASLQQSYDEISIHHPRCVLSPASNCLDRETSASVLNTVTPSVVSSSPSIFQKIFCACKPSPKQATCHSSRSSPSQSSSDGHVQSELILENAADHENSNKKLDGTFDPPVTATKLMIPVPLTRHRYNYARGLEDEQKMQQQQFNDSNLLLLPSSIHQLYEGVSQWDDVSPDVRTCPSIMPSLTSKVMVKNAFIDPQLGNEKVKHFDGMSANCVRNASPKGSFMHFKGKKIAL